MHSRLILNCFATAMVGLGACAREPLMDLLERENPHHDAGDSKGDPIPSPDDEAGDGDTMNEPDDPVRQGCLPGSYLGKMDCKVNFIGLIDAPNSGEMKLVLQEKDPSNPGEEFPVLAIAPGGTISGTDAYKGTITATLSGELDCKTGKITGKLVDGAYSNGIASQTYHGDFSGTYSEGPPAALVDGTMTMNSEQLPAVTRCTWSLTRTEG